ncbi:MAG TPA: GMC oxidoreductase [Gammaproteobacteria bacterium]|nr:GMC oxidoreductase [Gammaproteobacteria bacterium]
MNNIIVVGSGPAGISVANALLERGCKVSLLDAGNTLEVEKKNLLTEIQKNNIDVSSLKSNAYSKIKMKLPYGSQFIYNDVRNYFHWETHRCYLPNSFARGGLSNVWGSVLSEFSDKELLNWPASCRNLSKYYSTISSWFKTYYTVDTSQFLSRQAHYLKSKWEENKLDLNEKGFSFGQPILGVDFNQCHLCGLCQHGCPFELIHHMSIHLNVLKANKNFNYIENVVVENFHERHQQVELLVTHMKNRNSFHMIADRLFIACGAGLSSLLYLKSLNKKGKELVLKDSQHFFIPCLLDRRFENIRHDALHTLCQLKMVVTDKKISCFPVHMQLYTYMDLYEMEIKNKFKWFPIFLQPIFNFLTERLVVIQGYLDSRMSNHIIIIYNENQQFTISTSQSRVANRTISRIRKLLNRSKKNLSIYPIPFFLSKSLPGESNHVGGSLPMADLPQEDEVNIWGTPNHFKHVHFVDGSILPHIPAGPITFTIMANAYRIGKEVPL